MSRKDKGLPCCGLATKNPTAMQETQLQSRVGKIPLEKGTATHSSLLAWEIPWTEEPGELYSPWGRRGSDMT